MMYDRIHSWITDNLTPVQTAKRRPTKMSDQLLSMTVSQKATTMRATAVPIEFQTVLRLRPLLKREREDPIVLEPLPLEENQPPSVALHPLPLKNNSSESLTPSSALVLQTLSPDTVHTAHDVEFKFNHILNEDCNQDKVYSTLGLSTALSVMEPLKDPHHSRKTHLLISKGVSGSGKSYTCFGSHPGKRKMDTDGLVPRIIDSLFRQSKHHIHKRNERFGVNLQVLQVNQAKNSKSGTDCELYDLLQEPKNQSNGSILSSGSSTVRNMVATFERNVSTSSSTTKSSYSSIEEPVSIEQDPKSADFRVVNGQQRTCKTLEQARESLQAALQHSRKLTNSKWYQSHVLIQLCPILMDKNGNTVGEGGTIAVLDMAGMDSLPSNSTRTKRGKDTLPNRDDAHTAVLHCLRSLQHNDQLLQQHHSKLERRPSAKKVPYLQHKLTMLLQPLFSKTDSTLVTLMLSAYPGHRDYAEKKVLLHDLESLHVGRPASRAAETGLQEEKVTKQKPSPIKKALMRQQHRRPLSNPVATVRSLPSKQTPVSSERKSRKKERRSPNKVIHANAASDADDELSGDENECPIPKEIFQKKRIAASTPGIPAAASMTYSDSSLDDDEDYVVPMPPPIAPSYSIPSNKLPPASKKVAASAPLEDDVAYSMGVPIPGGRVSDFPGVSMPKSPSGSVENENIAMEPAKPVEKPLPVAKLVESPDQLPLQTATVTTSKQEPSSAGSNKFSPFKSFNKVVHASKKKGKEVMEFVRDATLDPERAAPLKACAPPMNQDDGKDENDSSLQLRLMKLEAQNVKLFQENSSLREKNENLQKENDNLQASLRDSLTASEPDVQRNTTLRSNSRENQNESLRPASRATRPNLCIPPADRRPSWVKESTSRHSWSSEQENEENWEQSRRESLDQKANVDDPLMQHIAQLSGQSTLGGNSWKSANKSQFSLNYPSSFTRASQLNRSSGLK